MARFALLFHAAPLLALAFLPGIRGYCQQPEPDPNGPFAGYTASRSRDVFPGVTPTRVNSTPLSTSPPVVSLQHLDPAQMSGEDVDTVAALRSELRAKAALWNFNLGNTGWSYEQIVCPALPDYVLLAFSHGSSPEGSSRFVAALPRGGMDVRIVPSFSHGMRPFDAAWNKPGTYDVFNHMLRQERGSRPLGVAPNWLVIALCYAELSGHRVQVLADAIQPNQTLDVTRLNGNRPQLLAEPGRQAKVTFTDVSRPAVTTNWTLRFDAHGRLVSVARSAWHQPARIALRP